jgi:hypothetical protein
VQAFVAHGPNRRIPGGEPLQDRPCAIGATIIHRDDLMRDFMQIQFQIQVFDGGSDAPFFITGWDYDAKQI